MSAQRFIFLHGTPGDRTIWDLVKALAPRQADCHYLDLPDHGCAEDEPDGDPLALELSVATRLERMGPGLTLVGHSYGAYLAARLAARLGGQVERVVAVSGFVAIPLEMARGFSDLADALRSGRATRATLETVAADGWYGEEHTEAELGIVKSIVGALSAERLDRVLRRLSRLAEPALRAVPLQNHGHVIHGRGDRAVPCALGEELSSALIDGSFEVIETDLHLLPLTHSELIARRIFMTF